jgi:hypothetical protein
LIVGAATLATPGARLRALHAASMPQKDNLCGCFWASLVLRAAGFETYDGDPVDEEAVAVVAGTTLPVGDPVSWVPPGAAPRPDYRVELPSGDDPDSCGTSSTGVARAIEEMTRGSLAVVPVRGPWTAATVPALVTVCSEAAPQAALIANLRTGGLRGTRPDPGVLLDHLDGGPAAWGPCEWDVGHFCCLEGAVRGRGGALVLVADSYPVPGWHGRHVQPEDAVAAALRRGDGRAGGVLCIIERDAATSLRAALGERGYEIDHWDNGSPDPVGGGP